MDGIGTSDIVTLCRELRSMTSALSGMTARLVGPGSRPGAGWVRIPSAIRGRNPDADEPSPRVGGRLIYG